MQAGEPSKLLVECINARMWEQDTAAGSFLGADPSLPVFATLWANPLCGARYHLEGGQRAAPATTHRE